MPTIASQSRRNRLRRRKTNPFSLPSLASTAILGQPTVKQLNRNAPQLYVYHQPKESETCQLIAQFDYPLGEEVVPLADEFQHEHPSLWPPVHQCGC